MSESKAFCVDWGIGNKWSTLRPFALIAVTNCDFIYLLIVFIFNLLAEAASFNHYFSILLFEHNAALTRSFGIGRFVESFFATKRTM
ncbi:hypothetical protein A3715_38280 [Oleiphilus sp. HI0009]|nr:hypothetical protein A3715_19655 [Oleiphilus sp. HI0009]KZX79710.1 hypothetical protein A3715_38280 [Oleiphilus sp. HI0009]